MKLRTILPALAASVFILQSCDDNKMNWYDPHTKDKITSAELPLELAEEISRYKAIKSYIPRQNFIIGLGMGMDLYTGDENYKALVDENFNSVTLGNAMKMSSIVNSKGECDFSKVDAFLQMLPSDMDLYGHNLIWHTQQAATYLKGLIAPEYLPDGDDKGNLLDVSALKEGSWGTWNPQNKGAGITLVKGAGADGQGYAIKMVSSETSKNNYDLQLISSDIPVIAGHKYELTFMVKSDGNGKGRVSFQNLTNNYPYQDWLSTGGEWTEAFEFGSSWTEVKATGLVPKDGATTFKCQFDFGYLPSTTTYIDVNTLKVADLTAETSSDRWSRHTRAFVEKTDEEKKEILDKAMKSWITDMVSHYKDRVHSWDVLNEPIDDGGKLRGVEVMPDESEMDNDDFYWGKYLGKDYAVKAFQYARQADPAAKLFVNDYNLESSENKLDQLIDYVNYIDANGAQVDGIGTQMHISITTDTTKIKTMFTKLAATGKLVRVTELDIKVNTSSPTAADLEKQANMYRFVIDQYKALIPEVQQAGFTIWSLSDNPDEHVYWIPDDAPCIFDANFKRKHAYKGVCDGLAGKDVGSEFSGELQTGSNE